MIDCKTGKAYTNIWFGSFYRPAYDDKKFVKEMLAFLKTLGFNSIMQDTKNQLDFAGRFAGESADQYVAMTEYMQRCIEELGMSHEFLALYLNGDNLYPDIRFSPPIYGESIVDADGNDGKWYRYWSDAAKTAQSTHVKGLNQQYGRNCVQVLLRNNNKKKPICTMWDPVVAPSFDEEGRIRYLEWLTQQYGHDIERLNAAYNSNYRDFNDLKKEDYWFVCRYPATATYTRQDLMEKNAKVWVWVDNMRWRKTELEKYFADMEKRLHAITSDLFLCPCMAQWGYFLNIDGSLLKEVGFSNLWDTSTRGLDPYELSSYVDCCHFITVPVTPNGDPDPYVVSCQHSMMRVMNRGREFIGGIFWGRFLYNDLYNFLTPMEIIGSMVANGISGYTSYGLGGLDDGGILERMGRPFLDSLKRGNEWMQSVLPLLGEKKPASLGILFPSAMAAFETMGVEGNKERRMDLLGWYKLCSDLGYECDILDGKGILEGALKSLQVLIIPANDCYELDPDTEMEDRIARWVKGGGILLHGPDAKRIAKVFGVKNNRQRKAPVHDTRAGNEGILVQGDLYTSYEGVPLATFVGQPDTGEEGAFVRNMYGAGKIYSIGFYYGYSYIAKIAPNVPREQKNNAFYPIPMMSRQWLCDILENAGLPPNPYGDINVETALFEHGEIVVNHNSYPVELKAISLSSGMQIGNPEQDIRRIDQIKTEPAMLFPRSATFIRAPKKGDEQ